MPPEEGQQQQQQNGDAGQQAAAAAAQQQNGDGGQQQQNQAGPWDGLTPEDRGYVDLHRFENPAALIKGHKELLSLRGVPADQLLKLPGKDAKPEDWLPVYQRLGWPEKPDGYKIDASLRLGEEQGGASDEEFNALVGLAHAMHVSQADLEKAIPVWNQMQQARSQELSSALEQDLATDQQELKKAWGGAYQEREEMARRAARTLELSQDDLDGIEAAVGFKRTMEILSQIGEHDSRVKEHDFVDGNNGPSTFGMTPEMAAQRLQEKNHDPAWAKAAITNPDGPEGQERERLLRIAYGSQ